MATYLPITLSGDNLGQRHRYLNSLVNEAYRGTAFQVVQTLKEHTPVDRLFKIDLASKCRELNYIINNLKDEDMLYVSRALKANWLLDAQYMDVVNPHYLEDVLFPEMLATAANKMRHWIHHNLRDVERCRTFYQYYYEKNFDIALKFLNHCSNEFVIKEFPAISDKISPHYFKMLCEKCADVAKIFFDSLESNESLLSRYLNKQNQYFNSIKGVLKDKPDLYLDIIEKYFNNSDFRRLSPSATAYILKNHRNRFDSKPELYTAWLLDINELAKCLTVDESKEITIKLAQAVYLQTWFSYKNVEPFIKRLNPNDRAAFKKKIFVDKDVGTQVADWPYVPPSPPKEVSSNNFLIHVFDDNEHDPQEYINRHRKKFPKRLIKKRTVKCDYVEECRSEGKPKTLLDLLFDQFRFTSFERTLYELRKKLSIETSAQARQYMMLVLVSKTGGRTESVHTLLELIMERHINEPSHLRATIVRSLVRRSCAWRLPSETWKLLLQFAHGLGLDGDAAEADCREGLHAVVLRNLINDTEDTKVRDAFLNEFVTLKEYCLNATERRVVSQKLIQFLLSKAESEETSRAAELIGHVFSVLKDYKIKIIDCHNLISSVASLAQRDLEAANYPLHLLYKFRVGRKELFKENFEVFTTKASYLNALRHDISVLNEFDKLPQIMGPSSKEVYKIGGSECLDLFFRKLAIYFTEPQGLASHYLQNLKQNDQINEFRRARALVILGCINLDNEFASTDLQQKKGPERRIVAALWANMHLLRPLIDVDWQKHGVKALANKVMICSTAKLGNNLNKLMACPRTIRLGLALSRRTATEETALATAATIRPIAALKVAFKYFKRHGESADPHVWDSIKSIIQQTDWSIDSRVRLRHKLQDSIKLIPLEVRTDYCISIFDIFYNINKDSAMPVLCNIENLLPAVKEEYIQKILLEFITSFSSENLSDCDYYRVKCILLYIRILAKYLLLCETEATMKARFESVGSSFLNRLKEIRSSENIKEYLDEFLIALRYQRMFFDNRYISCLPIFEKVIAWMREILPIEKNFSKIYVHLHLSMLYFKAIRKSVDSYPQIFNNRVRKLNEGVNLVGVTFGRYIATELTMLMHKYFDSIIEIYSDSLVEYYDKYFQYDISKYKLIMALIMGIVVGSKGKEGRLAVNVFARECVNFDDSMKVEICELIENKLSNLEMKMFMNFYLE